MCVSVCECVYVCVHVCVHECVCMCVCMSVCVCVRVWYVFRVILINNVSKCGRGGGQRWGWGGGPKMQ